VAYDAGSKKLRALSALLEDSGAAEWAVVVVQREADGVLSDDERVGQGENA